MPKNKFTDAEYADLTARADSMAAALRELVEASEALVNIVNVRTLEEEVAIRKTFLAALASADEALGK